MSHHCEKTIKQIDKAVCTGCGVCENVCPTGAITMEMDREGFFYPSIREERCVECEKCIHTCPIFREENINYTDLEKESQKVKVYAAWSLDPDIRYQSTSGGIFSELAGCILKKGGYISGAVYDSNHMVSHMITNNERDLPYLRQSKYVQSDMGVVYREIGKLLKQGKTVLFCGTPCQCESVFCYCRAYGIDNGKLYLIDFICRGSNSPKVYRKFLDELEEKYQSKVSKVWFKNKIKGWNCFSTKIEFENGETYLQDRYHDVYIRGYIEENLYIRPSCSNCRFKGTRRAADITLADFWGIRSGGAMHDFDGGTSMVMIHTERGKKLWDSITFQLCWTEKQLKDVLPGNDCFEHSVKLGEHREQFFKDLDNISVIENIERFLK